MLISRVFIIQTSLGIWTPILMFTILLLPSLLSVILALRCKKLPGDADTVVRNIFLYIFLYLIAIGPFHLLNATFGFKVYRFPVEDIHMEPLLLNGDAVIVHRGAYGIKNIGPSRADSVKVGDIVYHDPVPENIGGDNYFVHMVLAAPLDTLRAIEGSIYVNSIEINMPENHKYNGPENFGPVVVPKSQVFLVDNRGVFFPFYIDDIHGQVIGVLWSRTSRGSFRWYRFGRSIDWLFEPFRIWDDVMDILPEITDEAPPLVTFDSLETDIDSTK